eukprot:1955361-Pleurochrysis_carterae.AAC.3
MRRSGHATKKADSVAERLSEQRLSMQLIKRSRGEIQELTPIQQRAVGKMFSSCMLGRRGRRFSRGEACATRGETTSHVRVFGRRRGKEGVGGHCVPCR